MADIDETPGPRVDYVRFGRRLLRNYWKLICVLLVGIIAPTCLWVLMFAPRMYEASATIFIESGKEEPMFLRGMMSAEVSGLYLAILRSRSLAQAVVDSLPRDAREELVRQSLRKDFILSMQNYVRRLLRQEVVVYSPQEMAVMEVQEARMSFGISKDGTVTVTATAFNPRVATDLANTYTDVLLARSSSQAREQARATREMIENLLVQARTSQQEAEESFKKFQGTTGDVRLPEQSRLELTKLADLESKLSEYQVAREIAVARLNALRGQGAPSGHPDPAATALRQRLASLEGKLTTLTERYTEGHPLVASTRAEIEEVQQQLRSTVRGSQVPRTAGAVVLSPAEKAALSKQMADLEVEAASYQAKEAGIRQQIGRLRASLTSLNSRETQYTQLARSVETQRNLSSMLTDKLNSARMNEQATIRSIRIIDQASQPKSPSSKQMTMVLLGGIGIAVFVSFGAAFLLQTVNEVVETEDDVIRATGLPVLGCIPIVEPLPDRDAREPTNFLLDGPSYPLAMEACRSVRTSIEFQNSDSAPRTLLVASPGAGEGKSTVLYNLAWAFWETGRRMLVIDADLRRPALHRSFQIANEIGLVDVLRRGSEEVEASRMVKEGFHFLPSGIEPTNPGALLSSRNMRRLLDMGRDRHDTIIIDSPPVLAVSDNLALSSQVDAIVLVVRSGVTKRRNLVRAKAQLDKVRASIVGVVLNGLSPRDTRRYYAEYTHYVRAEIVEPRRLGAGRHVAGALATIRDSGGVIRQGGSRLLRITRLDRIPRRPNNRGGGLSK